MTDIQTRAVQTEALWSQGDLALAQGDLSGAYRLYTKAHDLVTDCARLHLKAHQKLRVVNRQLKNTERFTDSFLLLLAPVGMFELLAVVFRSRVARDVLCQRGN